MNCLRTPSFPTPKPEELTRIPEGNRCKWREENTLTIIAVMNNFHYLLNKGETEWKAVVNITENCVHIKDIASKSRLHKALHTPSRA